MPYAYGATIEHEFDVDHLNIWLTFRHQMKRSSDPTADPPVYDWKPDNALWLLECDTVAVDIVDSAWQDEFTMLLTSDTVADRPDNVTLQYDGPDEHLCTTWNKQWKPWSAALSTDLNWYENPSFVDRGDPGAADWTQATLTKDAAWHTLDCSAIVPAGAKSILFRINAITPTIQSYIILRKLGNANAYSNAILTSQVANIWFTLDKTVACDADRKVQYWISNVAWPNIELVIAGWFL